MSYIQSKFKNPVAISTTELVGSFLSTWSGRVRIKAGCSSVFTLDGVKVSDHDIGSPEALLPVFAWHADNLYRFSMRSAGLGVTYQDDSDAMLKRTVNLDRIDRAASEVLCFILEAVEDARINLPVSLNVIGAIEIRSLVSRFASEMGVTLKIAVDGTNELSTQARPVA